MENDSEVKFVNELEVSGFVNGVINMAFSTMQFVPIWSPPDTPTGQPTLVVSPEPKITVNMRFDLRLAQIMRDRLDQLIEENTKPKVTN